MIDGNGNVTTYGYDGFDRLLVTTYPGGSFEQLSYDSAANIVSRRLRDGQIINYSYDALNRLVAKDRPNVAYWETDHGYEYDAQNNLIRAWDSNGHSLSFGYDALGRKVSQGDNWYGYGNASYGYDAAGNRTRLTWGDGFYVTYEYNNAGQMTAIRENGGFVLASFGYDDLRRRTLISRGNGVTTSYAYDSASRLNGLALRFPNTGFNLDVGFGYNPAYQITIRTNSNSAYAWTGAVGVNRGYAVNGLNQYTQAGTVSFGYDGRGNLTSSGGVLYNYTSENQLASAPSGGYAYDPLGRLFNIAENGRTNTTLTYDDTDVLAEIDQNTGALLKRYVYGAGVDEPLVEYNGAGFDRRWLVADERGSIVAVSDAAGNATINNYDEYGIPGVSNQGRFQYTGQQWISGLGMYYYKARFYSPNLGRFLQADPIAYADGLNMYNYAGGDPVNHIDSLGLAEIPGSIVVIGNKQDCAGACFPDYDLIARQLDQLAFMMNAFAPAQNADLTVTGKRPQKEQPKKEAFDPTKDYCGSQGFNVPDGNWSGACKVHDDCYATPGENKERCDTNLAKNMTIICSIRMIGRTGSVAGCGGIGLLYGLGLMLFGIPNKYFQPSRDAYNDGQREN